MRIARVKLLGTSLNSLYKEALVPLSEATATAEKLLREYNGQGNLTVMVEVLGDLDDKYLSPDYRSAK